MMYSNYLHSSDRMPAVNPATMQPLAAACTLDRRRYFVLSEDRIQPSHYFFHAGELSLISRLGIVHLDLGQDHYFLRRAFRRYTNFRIKQHGFMWRPTIDIEGEGTVPLTWIDLNHLGRSYLETGGLDLVPGQFILPYDILREIEVLIADDGPGPAVVMRQLRAIAQHLDGLGASCGIAIDRSYLTPMVGLDFHFAVRELTHGVELAESAHNVGLMKGLARELCNAANAQALVTVG